MAKKKKKDSAWYECEGVNKKTGRVKKGWRPPGKGQKCPRPGTGGKTQRATKAKSCTPLIKKAMAVAYKRGYKAGSTKAPFDQAGWEEMATGVDGTSWRRRARRRGR